MQGDNCLNLKTLEKNLDVTIASQVSVGGGLLI